MMNCTFEQSDPDDPTALRCLICHFICHSSKTVRRNCPGSDEDLRKVCGEAADLLKLDTPRMRRHARDLIAWQQAGLPQRHLDEATWILNSLCAVCEHVRGDRCGCCAARGMPPLPAAVRMETVACPAYKW